MRRDGAVLWLLGACGVACGAVLFVPAAHFCEGMTWCSPTTRRISMVAFVLGLPLLMSLVRGIYAGVLQLVRTRHLIQELELLPGDALPMRLRTIAGRLGIHHRLNVVTNPGPEAFCYGLIWPRICVTTGLIGVFTDDELEAVLRHERHHLQQRDPLRILFWTVVDAACWRTGENCATTHVQRELAADRVVIAAGQRESLARALFKLLTHPYRIQEPSIALAVSRLSVTQARIDQLIGADALPLGERTVWHSRWYVVLAILAGVPLLCMVMLNAR